MEVKDFETWKSDYFFELGKKEKLTSNEKMILDLNNQSEKSSVEKNALASFLNNHYREYKRDTEYQIEREKSKEQQKTILAKLKKVESQRKSNNRKKREHELITIGALTDLTKFPKDRGTVTGAFLFILDRIKENPEFEHQLKIRGDDLLQQREIEKKGEAK